MNTDAARKLGAEGPEVFPVALGCMGMSGMYGQADERESVATIHEALERGVTLLDTGDFYGMGHNELLVGRALKGRRDGVLSRGLLSGSKPAAQGDFRARLPRFTGENLARNEHLVGTLKGLAEEKGITSSQLAVAWVLAKGEGIVPLIGARTRAQLGESLGALDVRLSPEELSRIEQAIRPEAVAGARYDEHQMRMLDSE